jgi:hypothetical protein
MTEPQRKRYEEAAEKYVSNELNLSYFMRTNAKNGYVAGCLNAHVRVLSQVETIIKTSPLGETEKFYLLEKIKLMKG